MSLLIYNQGYELWFRKQKAISSRNFESWTMIKLGMELISVFEVSLQSLITASILNAMDWFSGRFFYSQLTFEHLVTKPGEVQEIVL